VCIQKIAPVYIQEISYGCNSITAKINGVTHILDTLISYNHDSCTLSNSVSSFEIYYPGVDLEKVLTCFNCAEKVTLDNILEGVGNIVNSFNTNYNSNNTNLCTTCNSTDILHENKVLETLSRIEQEVIKKNSAAYDIHLLIFTLCLVIISIIIFIINYL
jgi:hypothetical protein